MKNIWPIILIILSASSSLFAQTGLTVGPPRVYFVGGPGASMVQLVEVTNPSKDYGLELAVSYEDWSYTPIGDNELFTAGTLSNSCADWLTISEPFFALGPGESKQLQLNMKVPDNLSKNSPSVHTTMLFVTQMNPRASAQQEGANIRLAVRSGIKIYHRQSQTVKQDVEIDNIVYHKKDSTAAYLELDYLVNSNTWTEGNIRIEYLNQETGKQTKTSDVSFYALPGDKRKHYTLIPKELNSGHYIATVMLMYGEQPDIKIGEIAFNHE
ncbi:molecular chaperone [Sphingobacterium sp. SGL-16]|uniref:fimbrial biogenesis chaperone n=1 Tax=Sphingobacterium sp. SGL-16 TaxID=2710883 RepID=UPI0013EC5AFA|nr:molecular chaperone [Sphingobacterium sp. SGL-16]NGM74215.1 molecular chaperone [Sphingobacterium sp. SGL-16]